MTNKTTEIIFLLDRSGSMSGLEEDTIGGFNGFIEKQSKLPGETMLTTILFDNEYEVLWDAIPATKAKLTKSDYFVRGYTALLDAIGKTIVNVNHRLAMNEENGRPHVIFVITTDGLENASKEFNNKQVKLLIEQQMSDYGWEFIYMGANIDAVSEANNIGISVNRAYNFTASQDGVVEMYDQINEVVMEQRVK